MHNVVSSEFQSHLWFAVSNVSKDPGFYSLEACECFGRDHRDVEPVTEDAAGLVPDAPTSSYNHFGPPPVLLFEGPYVPGQ